MQPIRPKLEIIVADITTLKVDAIVNAANPQLLAGGGVCGAIHAAAGPELERECVRLYPEGIQAGEAVFTQGFNAKAKWIIHAVAPRAGLTGWGDTTALEDAYRSSVALADALEVRSLAIPSLGTGIYGWDIQNCASSVISAIARPNTLFLRKIYLCCFTESDADAYYLASERGYGSWIKGY